MTTPLTAQLLTKIAEDLEWTHAKLGATAAIDPTTVTRHLSGARVIRDEHFVKYMAAVPAIDKPLLLAAWLRDVLPPADTELLLDQKSTHLNEAVVEWLPALDPDAKRRMQWLCDQMVRDPELRDLMKIMTKNFGYEPPAAEPGNPAA